MEPSETKRCFGCHTTASTIKDQFEPEHAAWGVTCEACHGPGADHAAAMKAEDQKGKELIFNPAQLDPVASVDFCGACHRTWQDVVGNGLIGAGMLNCGLRPTGWKTAAAGSNGMQESPVWRATIPTSRWYRRLRRTMWPV